MAEIGFVGLGNMGRPMALRLIAAGHAVRGFDVAAPAREAAGAAGIPVVGDLAAAAAGAEAVDAGPASGAPIEVGSGAGTVGNSMLGTSAESRCRAS